MSEIQEVPVTQEDVPPQEIPDEIPEEIPEPPQPKKTGRPKGSVDKKPRAPRVKAKAKAKSMEVREPATRSQTAYDEHSDDSDELDAQAMQRALRYMNKKESLMATRKKQQFAAWFGR